MQTMKLPEAVRTPRFRGGGEIEWVERAVPRPGPGEVLLRVRANAACGSDRPMYRDGAQVIAGHEVAGEVAAVGPGVDLAAGTPGAVFLMDYCGTCRSCRLGATNQCLAKRADVGFTTDGGYGPYALIHASNFFPIDRDLPIAEATLLLDVMGTCQHALRRARLVRPDVESLLVTGAGPIGLGLTAMSRILLGEGVPVYVTDVSPWRLEFAARLGARTIDLRGETLAEGLARHGAREVDAAVDASGRSAARQGAIQALAKRGVLVCVGHGEGLQLQVSPDLIATERAVVGSEYFRYDEMPDNLAILRAHRPYLRQIITHRYPVERLKEALDFFHAGECGKVVIEQ